MASSHCSSAATERAACSSPASDGTGSSIGGATSISATAAGWAIGISDGGGGGGAPCAAEAAAIGGAGGGAACAAEATGGGEGATCAAEAAGTGAGGGGASFNSSLCI